MYRQFCKVVGEENAYKYPKKLICRCVVDNYDDFIKVISISNDYFRDNYGQNIKVFYRGQKYIGWGIVSSISRKRGFEKYEKDLLNEFIEKDNKNLSFDINSVFLAQHYGIPTRLVDITKDEDVALFFASDSLKKNNGEEHNGRVFVIPIEEINNEIDIDFNLWQINNFIKLHNKTNDEIVKLYNLEKNKSISNGFINCQIKCVEYIGSNKSIEDRIKAQKGYGILAPIRVLHYKRREKPVFKKLYSSVNTSGLIAIDIKGDAKDSILQELSNHGVNENSIFPNDLEHFCRYVVQKYNRKE